MLPDKFTEQWVAVDSHKDCHSREIRLRNDELGFSIGTTPASP